jgi:signal transduction histidine kinase
LTVADDGRGVQHLRDGGYGIAGMRERAALATGQVKFTHGSGGTRVRLELPID